MKKRAAFISLLLIASAAQHAVAGETETMRCRGGLISIGDSAADVLAKCGEPAYRTQGVVTRMLPRTPYSEKTIVSVTADQWLFNFGPNEFQYQVLLDGGRVFRIESLDNHGY